MMNTKSDLVKQQKKDSRLPESLEIEQIIIETGQTNSLTKKLAEAHLKEGNYLRALNLFLKILGDEPDNARIWNKLAVTFIKLEEFDIAEDMSRIAFRMINNLKQKH